VSEETESLKTYTINTAVGSECEIELLTTPPPMWFVAGIRTDNDCFVPIPHLEVTVLIFHKITMHSRVMVAWTSWGRPSGKANNANRRSAPAHTVVVNVETNTSVGLFARNLSNVWRSDQKGEYVLCSSCLVGFSLSLSPHANCKGNDSRTWIVLLQPLISRFRHCFQLS
jgi:hypothetical protein